MFKDVTQFYVQCTAVDEGCGYEAEVSAGSLALESKPPEEGMYA